MRVSIVMGVPIAGWFLLGKISSFEMDDDWGYPVMTKRKPPNGFRVPVLEDFSWSPACGPNHQPLPQRKAMGGA